jgi:SAM-dependent methyltransferase
MSHVTSGVKTLLSNHAIYSFFQNMMGAHSARTRFVKDFVMPVAAGMNVLDIGCGPADILDYLPNVDYWGFDISKTYIQQARERFGARGKFFCQELTQSDVEKMPPFELVLAIGLLHHLDDKQADSVIRLIHMALKPGGRLLTLDPCFAPKQNPIARFLISNDRGQNVRYKEGYASLVSTIFKSPRIEVRHQNWMPYTHCFMECTRS